MPSSSAATRRYLEISRQPAGSAFHTTQVSISFGESVDEAALRSAWTQVARAHPGLRASFGPDGQIVETNEPAFTWKELDWKSSPPADLAAEWQSLVETDSATPIASAGQASTRFTLLRLPNGQGHALWSFHGALLDEAATSTALHHWLHAYDLLRTGEEPATPDPVVPDAELPDITDDEAWKETFAGFAPPRPLLVLPLPEAGTEPGTRRSISHTFQRDERMELAAAATRAGGDLRGLFGAAWALVIARATSADDALLLEPVRRGHGVGRREHLVPCRRAVETHAPVADLIRSFADEPLLPSAATAASVPEPGTAFIYRDLALNDRLLLAMPRWMAADTQLMQKTASPITLRVVANDRPTVALDYDPAVLSDGAARTLFHAFLGATEAFAADPSQAIADVTVSGPPAEVEAPEVPTAFCSLVAQGIHEMFADTASETPDAVAVEMDDETMTFAQLNVSANQFARLLRKRGVPAGARVGIAMARSPRWVAALLGTLKAGASVVPMDGTPADADVGAWIVDALPEGEERKQPVIQAQADAGALAGEKSRGMQTETTPASEAIATLRGDDARALSHEALAASLSSLAGLLGIGSADRVLQFAPTGTFAAVEETLVTLLSGATLVMRPGNRWPTRTAFQEFVREKNVTLLSVPAPFWSQWVHYLSELSIPSPSTLRLAVSTGELPSPNATAAWSTTAGQTRRLHRSEADAASGLGLAAEHPDGDPIAGAVLGQPGPATIARVVDRHGRPLPLGFPGNVEIAATRAAKKFYPLNVEAFVSPEGTFYSRNLLEIQVSGPAFCPPGEAIRHVARAHPQVLDAYSESHLLAARREWCLWIVPRDSERGEPHDFREWLTSHLPFPAPRRIRALPRFPLDDTGRIDVAALAETIPDDVAAPAKRQGTEQEERIRQAISRALGGRRIELDEILTDGRTKPSVARLLLEAVSHDEPRVELADFTTGFSVRSLLRNVRGRRSGADSAWTPLQPLRASGKLPPLVFIHDLEGSAKPYADLVAHLGDDQPCYAVTARGLADPDTSHASIEEMARAYVEALRVFDAAGPYRLLGYGFGGLVAFEMARQLIAAGATVPLLVALATEAPGNNSPASFLAGGWKRALPALFGRKAEDDTTGRRRRAQDTPVFRANQEAARKYSASPAPLTLHVFTPERDFPPHRTVQTGWNACCRDAHFYQVPCTGSEMMADPAVEAIAGAIKKLARAETLDADLEE